MKTKEFEEMAAAAVKLLEESSKAYMENLNKMTAEFLTKFKEPEKKPEPEEVVLKLSGENYKKLCGLLEQLADTIERLAGMVG
jgi:hypothetical protein